MFSMLSECLKIREKNKSRFLKAHKFLKKGRYFTNESGTLWYPKKLKKKALPENNHIILQQVYDQTAKKAKTGIKGKLIERFYSLRVKSQPLFFEGDVALLSRNPGVGKVINYSQKEILSFFEDQAQMCQVIEKHDAWKNLGYAVLPIFQVNGTQCFFTEEYIQKQNFLPEEGFEFIKDDILLRQKACGDDGLIVCSPEELAEKVEGLKRLAGKWEGVSAAIDFIQSPNYVKRVCHGDLNRNNLIFDGEKFWYIDFELLSPHIFFFDVISCFISGYLIFENDTLLNAFLAGEYDAYFSELFSVNHSVYDPAMKKVYLFLTLYEYFCESFKTDIPFDKFKSVF